MTTQRKRMLKTIQRFALTRGWFVLTAAVPFSTGCGIFDALSEKDDGESIFTNNDDDIEDAIEDLGDEIEDEIDDEF